MTRWNLVDCFQLALNSPRCFNRVLQQAPKNPLWPVLVALILLKVRSLHPHSAQGCCGRSHRVRNHCLSDLCWSFDSVQSTLSVRDDPNFTCLLSSWPKWVSFTFLTPDIVWKSCLLHTAWILVQQLADFRGFSTFLSSTWNAHWNLYCISRVSAHYSNQCSAGARLALRKTIPSPAIFFQIYFRKIFPLVWKNLPAALLTANLLAEAEPLSPHFTIVIIARAL